MNLINNFLSQFININNNLEKIFYYNKIFLDKDIYNSNINKKISNVFLVYKYNLILFKFLINKNISSKKDKIKIIEQLFEGYKTNITLNTYFCKTISFIKNLSYIRNINIFKISINLINGYLYENKQNTYKAGCNIYKSSLVTYPLTLNDSLNIGNYILNIFLYLNIRSNGNVYKSSLISLFYYYIGLLLTLFSMYLSNSIKILQSNLIIIVAKLSSFIKLLKSEFCSFNEEEICSIKYINIINNSLYLSNLKYTFYRPFLIGVTRYVMLNSGFLSKLSFRNTLKILKKLTLEYKIDWKVESKSNIFLSNFIPVGSGWYRYFIN